VDTDLAGRVVVITGAARGIGAATARAFAGEGARVVVNYRTSREQADQLVASLPDAIAVQADVSREDEVDTLFATAVERSSSNCVLRFGFAAGLPSAAPATAGREGRRPAQRNGDYSSDSPLRPLPATRHSVTTFDSAGGIRG